jgi:hypothetical protein
VWYYYLLCLFWHSTNLSNVDVLGLTEMDTASELVNTPLELNLEVTHTHTMSDLQDSMTFLGLDELLASQGSSAGQGPVYGFYHPIENLEACLLFIGLCLKTAVKLIFY